VGALTYQLPACEWRDETGLATSSRKAAGPFLRLVLPAVASTSGVACGLPHGRQLLTGPSINVSLRVLPRLSVAGSGGIKMGIQNAFRAIMLLAGRNGCDEGISTAVTRAADVPTGVGTGRTEADEKIVRQAL
jgi:hypothetical protein